MNLRIPYFLLKAQAYIQFNLIKDYLYSKAALQEIKFLQYIYIL